MSGWKTFRVFDDESILVAEVQEQSLASDLLNEFFFRFLGRSNQQDKNWVHVLDSLAAHLGVKGIVSTSKTLVDPALRWSNARNIRKKDAIRTFIYLLASPIRWIGNNFKKAS